MPHQSSQPIVPLESEAHAVGVKPSLRVGLKVFGLDAEPLADDMEEGLVMRPQVSIGREESVVQLFDLLIACHDRALRSTLPARSAPPVLLRLLVDLGLGHSDHSPGELRQALECRGRSRGFTHRGLHFLRPGRRLPSRRSRRGRQARVGQALAEDRAQRLHESAAVGAAPLVEAVCLLVKIAEQVKGLDRDVGALDRALQERPEVLHAVRVDLAFDVLLGVVDDLVGIIAVESVLSPQAFRHAGESTEPKRSEAQTAADVTRSPGGRTPPPPIVPTSDPEARRECGLCVVCLRVTTFIADRLGRDNLVLCWHCEAKRWELWKGRQPNSAEAERMALRERLRKF